MTSNTGTTSPLSMKRNHIRRPDSLPLIGSLGQPQNLLVRYGIDVLALIIIVLGVLWCCFLVGFELGGALREYGNGDTGLSKDHVIWSRVPRGWETYSRAKIRNYYKCRARDKDQKKPLPSLEDWQLMRKTFIETVDSKAIFDDPVPPTEGYTLNEQGAQPYYAKFSKGKGRGLFASRDIKKGELIHDGRRSDVVFPNALAWKRYIFSLPRDLACDTTSWNWTQRNQKGKLEIRSSINIAILMNSGKSGERNVQPKTKRSKQFIAIRDIAKDEEILYDYAVYETNWKEVGL